MKFDVMDQGIKSQYVPDEQAMEACKDLAKKIARALPAR
jgi:flavorubredoxin